MPRSDSVYRTVSGCRQPKVVAITGASSGIGEATAVLLAERGAKLVLGARRLGPLEALTARIADLGGQVACAPTDVRRRSDLAGLVEVARERFGRLDVSCRSTDHRAGSPVLAS